MSTLRVQVKPVNSGDINVKVWLSQPPGGTPIDETFTVNKDNPLNKSWELESALYSVTISWKEGYHNIASGTAGNAIIVNGKYQYYQVLGKPTDANGILANFGYQL